MWKRIDTMLSKLGRGGSKTERRDDDLTEAQRQKSDLQKRLALVLERQHIKERATDGAR